MTPLTKPEHLMIMGIPGSGSTVTLELAKEIIRMTTAPRARKPTGFGKMHGHGPIPDKGICTVRDFRDGLLSIARRGHPSRSLDDVVQAAWDRYEPRGFFNIEGAVDDPNVVIQRYEAYFPDNLHGLCRGIIEPMLGVKLPELDRDALVRGYSLERVAKRRHESGKVWLRNHITNRGEPGAWKTFLPQLALELRTDIIEKFIPLLITFGYEEDDSWAASLLQS